MSDENPILRSLLDSLTTIDKRLNLIEDALSIQPAPRIVVQGHAGHGHSGHHSSHHHHHHHHQHAGTRDGSSDSAGQVATDAATGHVRKPLPTSAPSSVSTTSSSPTAVGTEGTAAMASSVPAAASAAQTPESPTVSTYAALASKVAVATAAAAPFYTAHRHPSSLLPKKRARPLRLQHMPAKAADVDSETAAALAASASAPDALRDDDRRPSQDTGHPDSAQQADVAGTGAESPIVGAANAPSSHLPKELRPTGVNHNRLEALPEGFLVMGRATLQEELDGWTIQRGYSMRINGTRSHGRRQKIRMVCFRGGRSRLRPKEEEAKRERERERRLLFPDLPPRRRKPTTDRISKKCECPFRFELVEISPGADRYAVHYTNDDHMQHNHAAADLMLDPRARKLPRALKAEVDQWLRSAGSGPSGHVVAGRTGGAAAGGTWTIAKIQAELQRRGYGHVLDFDLRNRKRALLHKERTALMKKENGGGDGSSNGDNGDNGDMAGSGDNGSGEAAVEDDDEIDGEDGSLGMGDTMQQDAPRPILAAESR